MTDPEPLLRVYHSDDGILIAWPAEEPGHSTAIALPPLDAMALACSLIRAFDAYLAHRELIADVDDAFPGESDEPPA